MAMLAYGIAASAARAPAAPGSPARSLAAGWAGTASITASASSQAGAWADPTVSRQPPGADPGGGDGGISAPAASVSDARRRDSAARPGSVASNDRASDRPA